MPSLRRSGPGRTTCPLVETRVCTVRPSYLTPRGLHGDLIFEINNAQPSLYKIQAPSAPRRAHLFFTTIRHKTQKPSRTPKRMGLPPARVIVNDSAKQKSPQKQKATPRTRSLS